MQEQIIEHDEWNYSPPKLKRASKIDLGAIYGLLPFDGVRNPSSRSSTAHRVFLTYKTAANDWKPKVGICESSAEAAVAFEALIAASTHDLHFQPLTVEYRDEDGRRRRHTFDLRITNRNGHRRLVFVRNEASLDKPRTQREIQAIAAATPAHAADDLIVVNANDYIHPSPHPTTKSASIRPRYWVFEFLKTDARDQPSLDGARLVRALFMPCLGVHAYALSAHAFGPLRFSERSNTL